VLFRSLKNKKIKRATQCKDDDFALIINKQKTKTIFGFLNITFTFAGN
jgi:hypothetical protein